MLVIPSDISSDEELKSVVDAVGTGLQLISNYLELNPSLDGKVRFPRGFLGTAHSHSKKYSWIENDVLRRNMSYQYIFHDVLSWVNTRTDIAATAKEMIYKHSIVVVSSIAEGLLAAAVNQIGHKEGKFPKRLNRLLCEGVITQKLHGDLTWMWDLRQSVHIHIVSDLEWRKYKASDANRSFTAVQNLEDALMDWFEVPF